MNMMSFSVRSPYSVVFVLVASFALTACVNDRTANAGPRLQPALAAPVLDRTDQVFVQADLSSRKATTRFLVEESLGAECRPYSGSASTWEFDQFLARIACYGRPPAHIVHALSSLPAARPGLTGEIRERISRNDMHFLAVPGLGARADFVVYLDDANGMWARSFEGADPSITVYMVFGPEADPDKSPLRDYRVYRVHRDGLPQDATDELAPEAPKLNDAERRHYGPYVDDSVEMIEAKDSDIVLNPAELPYSPLMAWKLQQAESTRYGMTGSDPRWAGDHFHFGFLVWNGYRFVLMKEIRYTDIYCLKYRLISNQDEIRKPCGVDRSINSNPFVIDDRVTSDAGKSP